MRILQVNNHHYVGGGSERVYRDSGRILAEHGHEVAYVSTYPASNSRPRHQGVFYEAKKYGLRADRFFYNANVYKDVSKFISQFRPNVAHLHIFYGRLTSAILAALADNEIPIIMTVHEYRMLCPVYVMRDWKGRICEKCAGGAYWHAIWNRCNKGNLLASSAVAAECYFRDQFFDYSRHIDRFVFVSDFALKTHIRFRPELSEKSDAIFNPTDLSPERVKPSTGIDFLYAGRLSREKGLCTLLDAVSMTPGVSLRIAGSGPEAQSLKQKAKDLDLEDRIQFLGYLNKDQLAKQIRSSKWVIVPSEWYENISLAVIEAFSHGVPVLGADIGGIPELVKDRETGLLFRPRDAHSLANMLSDALRISDLELDDMGRNARNFVEEKCNTDIYYWQLMKVYQKALRNTKNLEKGID